MGGSVGGREGDASCSETQSSGAARSGRGECGGAKEGRRKRRKLEEGGMGSEVCPVPPFNSSLEQLRDTLPSFRSAHTHTLAFTSPQKKRRGLLDKIEVGRRTCGVTEARPPGLLPSYVRAGEKNSEAEG